MLFKNLRDDVDAIMHRDPAARSRLEVMICYPGLHALLLHRLAHVFWVRNFRLLGRMTSQFARWLTGIEIHPGATIGRRFFVDHGMGVVIGETAEIGNDVTLYQGVTLGGTSPQVGKRHPTLEDGVIIGAGAKVLGPIILREGSRVGSNAVVLAEVPRGASVVGIPAKVVAPKEKSKEPKGFCAYGTPSEGLPDPVARAIDGLCAELVQLRARVEEVERRQPARDVEGGHADSSSAATVRSRNGS